MLAFAAFGDIGFDVWPSDIDTEAGALTPSDGGAPSLASDAGRLRTVG